MLFSILRVGCRVRVERVRAFRLLHYVYHLRYQGLGMRRGGCRRRYFQIEVFLAGYG